MAYEWFNFFAGRLQEVGSENYILEAENVTAIS